MTTLSDIATSLGTRAGKTYIHDHPETLRATAESLRATTTGVPQWWDADDDALLTLLTLVDDAGVGPDDQAQLLAAYRAAAAAAILAAAAAIEDADDLIDGDTNEVIRKATLDERWESALAARRDGGCGAISVDGRTCYTGP